MMFHSRLLLVNLITLPLCVAAVKVSHGQETRPDSRDTASLKAEIDRERAVLDQQRKALDAQEARLRTLEEKISSANAASVAAPIQAPANVPTAQEAVAGQVATAVPAAGPSGVESVGEAPSEPQKPQSIAALGDQGGVITRRKRLTLEGDFEYAHADNNEVIFRGIEVPQSVLVGVFDINETRQDILTAALVSRYGISNRLEANIRLPYVYRTDGSDLPPVDTSATASAGTGTQEYSAHAFRLGDAEFGLRYQFTDGHDGLPFLIGGIQVLTPSGTSPYFVPRDTLGNPTKSATGAGFWAIEPTITALLPTDPAVLFGSFGYTYNFCRDIGRMIGDAEIDRVCPGGEPSFNVGIGISLNPRTAVSFAYAHTWSFGTRTNASVESTGTAVATLGPETEATTRDLQIGQFIFGVSYRMNEKTTFNWNIEIGATNDAPSVVTTFRVPFGVDL